MKRKIFLVSFVVILVVAGIVGGVITAQAAPSGQTTGGRLHGSGGNGKVYPVGDSLYYSTLGVQLNNPDLQYGKTIERIVVTDGNNTANQWDVQLSSDEAWLAPNEILDMDLEGWGRGVPIGGEQYMYYTVDVYWSGRGVPLLGKMGELFALLDSGGQLKELVPAYVLEMVNISR